MSVSNRDLSIIFNCMSKGRKAIKSRIQNHQQNDEDYLNEVNWSPANTSINSTTNFCNSDSRRSKFKKNLNERRLTNNEFVDTNSNLLSSTISNRPIDRYNLVYLSLILSGICFLLPYNSFVIAVDYFQDHYPNSTIVFDISSIYIIVQFVAVCINNTLVSLISFKIRIFFGYLLSLITLTVVSIFEIGYDLSSHDLFGYQLNLFCVAIVSFGCTVQQSSFYGLSSMLPKSYTSAIMIGESLSGLLISLSRILTKYLIKDEQLNTLIFFIISIVIIIICCLIHFFIKNDPFILYYVNNCKKENSNLESYISTTSLTATAKNSFQEENNIELIVKLNEKGTTIEQQNVPKSDSTEFDLPFGIDDEFVSYSQQQPSSIELETNLINQTDLQYQSNLENLVENNLQNERIKLNNQTNRKLVNFLSNFSFLKNYFKQGLEDRIKLIKLIYPYMLSISLTYLLTLALFPGVESEIENCNLKSWTPVILFLIFNLNDVIGKVLAKYLLFLSSQKLIFFSAMRFFLLPLCLLCAVPNDKPILSNFFYISLFTVFLGLTNGIFGSLPMILAPNCVVNKELTGNLMTIAYSIGLILGTFFSYVIEYMFFDVKHYGASRCTIDHD